MLILLLIPAVTPAAAPAIVPAVSPAVALAVAPAAPNQRQEDVLIWSMKKLPNHNVVTGR